MKEDAHRQLETADEEDDDDESACAMVQQGGTLMTPSVVSREAGT